MTEIARSHFVKKSPQSFLWQLYLHFNLQSFNCQPIYFFSKMLTCLLQIYNMFTSASEQSGKYKRLSMCVYVLLCLLIFASFGLSVVSLFCPKSLWNECFSWFEKIYLILCLISTSCNNAVRFIPLLLLSCPIKFVSEYLETAL